MSSRPAKAINPCQERENEAWKGKEGRKRKKRGEDFLKTHLLKLSPAPSSDKLVSQLSHSVIYH